MVVSEKPSGFAITTTQTPFWRDLRRLFGTTNHEEIGLLYLFFALINFCIALDFGVIMRVELLAPGEQFLSPQLYSSMFSTHGTIMIFFVIFPATAGFANYIMPKLIGAKDLYWPRWNNAAFWLLVPASLLVWSAFANAGWTVYTPYSTQYTNTNVTFWTMGVLLGGVSSMIGAMNLILTIIAMRDENITWKNLDLFSWSIIFSQLIQLFATPMVALGLIMILFDRMIGTNFLSPTLRFGDLNGPVLFQNLFWGYGHPAVYIIMLPAMGLASMLIATFSQNKIFGYKAMVWSMGAIMFLGFYVWAHHMFTIGASTFFLSFFMLATLLIALPSGVKTFNWLLTMEGGKIRFEAPFLFSLGFIISFVFGGLSGVFNAIVPLDLVVHDTYWIVGHFHMIIVGGAASPMIGTMYYLYPHITKRMYNKKLALWHWILWTVGTLTMYGTMHVLGLLGMPRRYFDYSIIAQTNPLVATLQIIVSIGAFIIFLSVILWIYNFAVSLKNGEPVGDNPFNLDEDYIWYPKRGEKV